MLFFDICCFWEIFLQLCVSLFTNLYSFLLLLHLRKIIFFDIILSVSLLIFANNVPLCALQKSLETPKLGRKYAQFVSDFTPKYANSPLNTRICPKNHLCIAKILLCKFEMRNLLPKSILTLLHLYETLLEFY